MAWFGGPPFGLQKGVGPQTIRSLFRYSSVVLDNYWLPLIIIRSRRASNAS